MTKFVVDAGAVLHLASPGVQVAAGRKLLAPTLLRSQTLAALHEAVHRGALSVTMDAKLARRARTVVAVASIDELVAPRRRR
jgi:hypothetical protein